MIAAWREHELKGKTLAPANLSQELGKMAGIPLHMGVPSVNGGVSIAMLDS
jgi:hypothetical protein